MNMNRQFDAGLKPLIEKLIEEGSDKTCYLSSSIIKHLCQKVRKSYKKSETKYWFFTNISSKVQEALANTDTGREARKWLYDYIKAIEVIEVDEYSKELDDSLKVSRGDEWYILSVRAEEVAA